MPDETEHKEPVAAVPDGAGRELPAAAQRALAEAEARRNAAAEQARPKELGGRGGLEPTRYGDWEKDGIAHDF
jgi:hypothetical protein